MRKMLNIMTLLLIVLFMPLSSYAKETLGVNYIDYTYQDEGSIVTYSTDALFVISDYRDTHLKPYEEPKVTKKEGDAFVKPVISLKTTSDTLTETTQPEQKEKQVRLHSEYVIYFDFDSYKIRKSEFEKIKNIPVTNTTVADVYGYTCKIGSPAYNLKLSKKRANAVAKALQKQGIPVGEVKGMGITTESEILKFNRKAVIKISQ